MKDRGIVVFGKVEQGTITVGEKLTIMPSGLPCQIQTIYNSKEQPVQYAKPGENIKLRLLHIQDESMIQKGEVLCNRDAEIPVSDLIEVELELLELLSYKPILSKGYQFVIHIHTVADDAVIKDLLVAYEKNDRGEITEKIKPQFTTSFSRVICRIQTRIPIALEKHDTMPQMGRFTLRDEGKTIALGKVIKYKPVKVLPKQETAAATTATQSQQQQQEEEKKQIVTNAEGEEQIDTATSHDDEHKKKCDDLIFDLDSGEMLTKEEYQKRQKEREMEEIGEEEDYGDEDDEDEENDDD